MYASRLKARKHCAIAYAIANPDRCCHENSLLSMLLLQCDTIVHIMMPYTQSYVYTGTLNWGWHLYTQALIVWPQTIPLVVQPFQNFHRPSSRENMFVWENSDRRTNVVRTSCLCFMRRCWKRPHLIFKQRTHIYPRPPPPSPSPLPISTKYIYAGVLVHSVEWAFEQGFKFSVAVSHTLWRRRPRSLGEWSYVCVGECV